MIEFKYTNTMKEYIDGYKLMIKLRKVYFVIFNILPIVLGLISVIAIAYSFEILFKYISLGIFSIQIFLPILIFSFLLYELFTLKKRFLRSVEKKLKAKPNIFKELTLNIEDNKFLCNQEGNRTEILFSQIYKFIEYNDVIYIFGDGYLIFLIIPSNVFKNSEEKNKLLKIIEGFNT
ncbi:YcxB family protein [Paraclostridium bifermentans]|jgi:hypothetical protein|uniref:YcxB family protein n=1 Tax=Paraclostridium bifermentans TaxID=1490 RepID=UPI001899214C|nr:YcxB family protein [Paraclostridium bifermentans]